MCGSKPRTPEPVRRDPVAEQLEADRKATEAANAEAASRGRARRNSSLLATAGKQAGLLNDQSGSVLASARPQGKTTLGG